MKKIKNGFRTLYEKVNIYIYIVLPIGILILYKFINCISGFNLMVINTYKENVLDISMALVALLLTIMGLFTSLPNTEMRELMKKYSHDKIINRTLFLGVLTSLLTLILSIIEKCLFLQSILFIVSIVETLVASIWLYKTLMYIND